MKICSNYSYQYSGRNVSFGTIERIVYQPEQNGSRKIQHRNHSYLFRFDLAWDTLVKHITKDDKARKIYCYACSDGSEPYSLAIALISKLGREKAQKYFPIIARDSDEFVINKAKGGTIMLTNEDISRISEYSEQPGTNFFTKITNEYPCEFRVNKDLYNCVDFEKGDILKDSEHLNYDGSVILFRNVWPYLKREEQISLLKTFSKKFSKDTSLVIGAFDLQEYSINSENNIFRSDIWKYGFWQTSPKIYQLHNININFPNEDERLKILTHKLYEIFFNNFTH